MTFTRQQIFAFMNPPISDDPVRFELCGQLDEAMRFLKIGHDKFHGSLISDNCEVRVDRYFELGKFA